MTTNYGIKLEKKSGETFATVGKITNLDVPELMNEAYESTNHASGGWKEFESGMLKELGEFTFTLDYVEVDGGAITTDLLAGLKGDYKITFPNSITFSFSALITSFKPNGASADSAELLSAEVTMRPSGALVIA